MQEKAASSGSFIVALAVAFGVIALISDQPAFAQNVEAGGQIAKTWCAGCHLIGRTDQKIANDATPSFASIARMNSTTSTSLEVFLSTPHAKMPDYTLTRDEIRNVSAYIMSLRK